MSSILTASFEALGQLFTGDNREMKEKMHQATLTRMEGRLNKKRNQGDCVGNSNQSQKLVWTKHLTVLLEGTRDPSSPLHLFRGHEHVIIQDIYARLYESWSEAVEQTPPACNVGRLVSFLYNREIVENQDYAITYSKSRMPASSVLWSPRGFDIEKEYGSTVLDHPKISFAVCGCINFPFPQGININMMPFVLGRKRSLPAEIRHYHSVIMECPVNKEEIGKVCYSTIHEGFVSEEQTQRRSGLHIEGPNRICSSSKFLAAPEVTIWGRGEAVGHDEFHGGLFMASSVDDSCAIWNALVVDKTAVDRLGGMENLRPFLGKQHNLKANELVWFTDCTPHEALPQTKSGHRQFFRIVTSDLSHWYEEHSTLNPLVSIPKMFR